MPKNIASGKNAPRISANSMATPSRIDKAYIVRMPGPGAMKGPVRQYGGGFFAVAVVHIAPEQ